MGQSRDLSVMILRRISHSLFPVRQMASWPRAYDNFLTSEHSAAAELGVMELGAMELGAMELGAMELWCDGTWRDGT
jgi:hypothetical protein